MDLNEKALANGNFAEGESRNDGFTTDNIISQSASFVNNIPEKLKILKQWVVYGKGYNKNRQTNKYELKDKIPYNPINGIMDNKNPENWVTFGKAVEVLNQKPIQTIKGYPEKYSGLGFNFNNNGIVGIDIDTCVNPETSEISDEALYIINTMDSYTEYSPSGYGVHIYIKAEIPKLPFNKKQMKSNNIKRPEINIETGEPERDKDGNIKYKKPEIEIYNNGRYFTVTGNVFLNKPVEERNEQLQEILNYFNTTKTENAPPKEDTENKNKTEKENPKESRRSENLSDEDILKIALNEKGGKFYNLFVKGDISAYSDDWSRADEALCAKLAFYFQGEFNTIDYMFRRSALIRDKWNEKHGAQTYGQMTINKAIDNCNSFYKHKAERKDKKEFKNYDNKNQNDIDLNNLSTLEELTDRELLYEILRNKNDEEKAYNILILKAKAKELKCSREFDKICKIINGNIKQERLQEYLEQNPNGFYFDSVPVTLVSAAYRTNDNGIFSGEECIIQQPVIISKIFKDIENLNYKLEIAYKNADNYSKWNYITVPRELLKTKKITALSNYGIKINEHNADDMIDYFETLETENSGIIPVVKGVSHMGFINNDFTSFVPYANDLEFNGEQSYKSIYNSVRQEGSFELWKNTFKNARKDSLTAWAYINAAFASPLIAMLDKLIFLVNSWGFSGLGKTVSLKSSASVWGNPNEYIKNLNSTTVGSERNAHFYHNLPVMLDEFQTLKNKDNITNFVYTMTEGQGRTRGTQTGGVEPLKTWKCIFLTNGEQPLTTEQSTMGELNRIIDIHEITEIFKDFNVISDVISNNYGHAGKYFIEHLHEYDVKAENKKWDEYIKSVDDKTTGKQQMSAGILLTANYLSGRIIFDMDENQAENDTVDFWNLLKTSLIDKKETDTIKRAYDFIIGWVAENIDNFKETPDINIKRYGKFMEKRESVFILNNALENALEQKKFNYKAVLTGLNEKNYTMKTSVGENTKKERINGLPLRGIELKLPKNGLKSVTLEELSEILNE